MDEKKIRHFQTKNAHNAEPAERTVSAEMKYLLKNMPYAAGIFNVFHHPTARNTSQSNFMVQRFCALPSFNAVAHGNKCRIVGTYPCEI